DVVSYRSGPANWVDARRGITLRDRDERSSLAIHVCFLRETGSSTSTTRNMEETGVLEKVNLSGFCYLALNQVNLPAKARISSPHPPLRGTFSRRRRYERHGLSSSLYATREQTALAADEQRVGGSPEIWP